MAKEHSFDFTAEINIQELRNVIDQAQKEINTRYDFKGVKADIEHNEKAKTITITTSTDNKLEAINDILISKAIKRGLSSKVFKENKKEDASGGNVRSVMSIVDTISSEDAKKITKTIKDLGLKVQASIRGDVVRVEGKSIDDLQQCIKSIKEALPELPVYPTNLK